MSWRRLEDVFKTSWRRLEDFWKSFLQNVLKTFRRRLEYVFKAFWRLFCKTSWNGLEDVLKTSWRRLEDVRPRQIYWSWPKRLEDVLKASSEDVKLRQTYSSWSRRLEEVFWRRRWKTSSRWLHQDESFSNRIHGLFLINMHLLFVILSVMLKKSSLNDFLVVL